MGKIILILIILALGWCFYTGQIDLSNFKENSIEKLKKEKTINKVNSSRERRQEDINKIINQE